MKRILVTAKNGKPTISTNGFTGDSCLTETARLESAFGGAESQHVDLYETLPPEDETNYETN